MTGLTFTVKSGVASANGPIYSSSDLTGPSSQRGQVTWHLPTGSVSQYASTAINLSTTDLDFQFGGFVQNALDEVRIFRHEFWGRNAQVL